MGSDFNKQKVDQHLDQDKFEAKDQQVANQEKDKNSPNKNYAIIKSQPVLSDKVCKTLNRIIEEKALQEPQIRGIELQTYYIKQKSVYYKGDWRNGRPYGKGRAYFQNGSYLYGIFKQGQCDCKDGVFIFFDGSYYRGQIKSSRIEGKGQFKFVQNGLRYIGDWKNGKPNGKGQETYGDGGYYVGQFRNGLKDGKGILVWADGRKYEGEFSNGYMDGNGIMTKGVGKFEGTFVKGNRWQGYQITEYGKYMGKWKDGQMQDQNGKFIWNDGKIYVGGFSGGKINGKGTIYFPNDQRIEGIWKNGQNTIINYVFSEARDSSK